MRKKSNFGITFLLLVFLGFAFSPANASDYYASSDLAVYTINGLSFNNQVCSVSGENVTFALSVINAPNDVESFGLNINYDENILEFVSFNGALPEFMISGSKALNFPTIKVGGFMLTPQTSIVAGYSGKIGEVAFKVKSCEATTLSLSNLIEGMANWPIKSGHLTMAPPLLQEIGDQIVLVGNTLTFSLRGANEVRAITYSIANSPAEAYFGTQSGEFIWEPQDPGTFSMIITATDSSGKSESENVQITAELPDDYPLPEIEKKGACEEEDTGQLDIVGISGSIGQEIQIPIRIQNAPQIVDSMGFDVDYPHELEYKGYKRGDLTTKFSMFDVSIPAVEKLRVGGMDFQFGGIPEGASGVLIYLTFEVKNVVVGGVCYPLTFERITDKLKEFIATGGYFYMDNTAPRIFCPQDRIVAQIDSNGTSATNPDILAFLDEAKALDDMDGELEVFNDAPAIFGPGQTSVTFIADDNAGNRSACTSTITIEPIECVENDSGNLDIPETTGKIGEEVWIPVQAKELMPNNLAIFTFLVHYNSGILEYAGYERGNMTTNFPVFKVTPLGMHGSGTLMIDGLSGGSYTNSGMMDQEICVDPELLETSSLSMPTVKPAMPVIPSFGINNTAVAYPILSGDIVLLKFIVKAGMNNSCYPLTMSDLMFGLIRDLAATPGCFCIHSCTGDQNGDGDITPQDALIVFMCYLGSGPCTDCCDVNGDGDVTPADALCLFQEYLGQPSCLDQLAVAEVGGGHIGGSAASSGWPMVGRDEIK